MKICIITLYNSMNSGSHWQARALESYIKRAGHEVFFLKRSRKGTSASIKWFVRAFKPCLKLDFAKAYNRLSTYLTFRKACRHFKTIKLERAVSEMDLVVLGSDTIWNFSWNEFLKSIDVYCGAYFPGDKVVSYAASVANTDYQTLKAIPKFKEYLSRTKRISVRDEHSSDMVKRTTGITPEIVCDPTLLFDKSYYSEFTVKPPFSGYVFLYLFEELNQKQKSEIMKFAEKKGLKVISGTEFTGFSENRIINTPINFISYIYYADYVIADTFHGTVFAVNFEKRLAVINENKNKINDFLRVTGFDDRLIEQDFTSDTLLNVFEKEIDYSDNSEKINEYRNKSREYLNECLNSGKE